MAEHCSIELIQRVRSGDKDSQRELIQKVSRPVFALCLALLSNTADAEDVAQETIYKAITNIDSLQDSAKFRSWLFAIARNCCHDFLRKRTVTTPIHETSPVNIDEPGIERQIVIKNAIEQLPQNLRVPILLFYFDGHSAKSVAENLEISEETAFARLSRARKALREILCKPLEIKKHVM